MGNNSGKGDIRFRATIKPFADFGRGEYRVMVEEDCSVLVWDEVGSQYTRLHSLSDRTLGRLRREAAKISRALGVV